MKIKIRSMDCKTTREETWKAHRISVQHFKGGRALVILRNKKGRKFKTVFYRRMEHAEKMF